MIKLVYLVFDRDDCAELVRRDACGRRVDDAGRQRGLVSRLFGGRDRADLGPAAAEDAARGGGVRFVLLFLAADVCAGASEKNKKDE